MAAFDVDGARKSGYSDTEITNFLGASKKFDVERARQSGYSDSEILGHLLKGSEPAKPAAARVGDAIRQVPRQAGLTARYALEGVPAVVDLLASPFKAATDAAYGMATGRPGFRSRTMSETGGAVANVAGLPTPQGANERVIGDVARTGFGAAGGIGLAGRAADLTQGVTQSVARSMASNPGQQFAAAGGAGGAGGSVRESGGGPVEQMFAALAGGVAGGVAVPVAAAKGQQVADATRRAFAPAPSAQTVDLKIRLALDRQGIDYAGLSDDVKASLRADVSNALKTEGDIRPEVVARLADFRTVGATPTRGTITLDPVQLTREKNLAKTGANSTDIGMQQLSRVENANNAALIDALNRSARPPVASPLAAGDTVIGAVRRNLDAADERVGALYSQARDSAGRSAPMNPQQFATRANDLLDQNLAGDFLPAGIRSRLNSIATGEAPFRVTDAEQLRTALARISRNSNDGNVRAAVGFVRQALDDTDILPMGQQSGPAGVMSPRSNPGNLPVPDGSTQAGKQAAEAFTKARAAYRALRQKVESAPGVAAIEDGAQPDQFVQRFVLGSNDKSSVAQVRALRDFVQNDADALAALRGEVARYLKKGATGGAPDDVANFSASGFRQALRSIGDEKMALFFSPQEIAQLQAASRVAGFTLVQQRGTAVGNSNSGAVVTAGALDFLERLASRMPIGRETIQGSVRGVQQRQALDPSGVLVSPPITPQMRGLLQSSPSPAAFGLLLSAPAASNPEERRRSLLSAP